MIIFYFFGLHCVECRIIVPGPEIEPMSPALGVISLNHWTTREVPHLCAMLLGLGPQKECCMLLCHCYYFCTDLLSLGVLELVEGREGAPVSSCFQSRAWSCVEIRCSGRLYQRKEKYPGLSWDLASGSNRQTLWILTSRYRKEAISAQVSEGPVSGSREGMLGGVEGQIVGVQRGQGKGELDTLEALFVEPEQWLQNSEPVPSGSRRNQKPRCRQRWSSWGQEVSCGQQQLLSAYLSGFPPPFIQPQDPDQGWEDPRASGSSLSRAWHF